MLVWRCLFYTGFAFFWGGVYWCSLFFFLDVVFTFFDEIWMAILFFAGSTKKGKKKSEKSRSCCVNVLDKKGADSADFPVCLLLSRQPPIDALCTRYRLLQRDTTFFP